MKNCFYFGVALKSRSVFPPINGENVLHERRSETDSFTKRPKIPARAVWPIEQRIDVFWQLVEKRGADECWNWNGRIGANNYPIFCWNREAGLAHRFSWLIHFGEIPKNTRIVRICKNDHCVNPSHLKCKVRPLSWGSLTPREKFDYFWSHARISWEIECWLWTGKIFKDSRYGRFNTGEAHRFAYEFTFGKIKLGMHICHRCDNRLCVNPNHLFQGTSIENNLDMRLKGRAVNPPRWWE